MKIEEIKNNESDGIVSASENSDSDNESEVSDTLSDSDSEQEIKASQTRDQPVAGLIFSITPEIQALLDEKDKQIKKLNAKLYKKAEENSELKLQVKYLKEDAESEKGVTPSQRSSLTKSNAAGIVKKVAVTAGFALAGLSTVAALGFLGTIIAPFALPLLGAGLLIAITGVAVSKILQCKNNPKSTTLPVKSVLEKKDSIESLSEQDFVF